MSICLNDGMAMPEARDSPKKSVRETAWDDDSRLYDDDDQQVMTGEAVGLDLRPTSYVLAAAGAAIDWVVYLVVAIAGILLMVFLLAAAGVTDSAVQAALTVATIAVSLVVIPVAVETLTRGKSLGRLAVGARIVRDDGGAIGFRHAFIRGLMWIVEVLPVGGIAALVGLFSGRSKRLGDYLAGTYSQYERVSNPPLLIFAVPTELESWARIADVARIPNRLSQRMSQFLRNAHQLTATTREQLARQLANEASAYVSPLPAVQPELFVAGVVALRRDREFAALLLEKERLSHLGAALTGSPYNLPER
jgi:uncharacterized RDD family membrane protein YckC